MNRSADQFNVAGIADANSDSLMFPGVSCVAAQLDAGHVDAEILSFDENRVLSFFDGDTIFTALYSHRAIQFHSFRK